jgi:ABC-type proline/glycine betaine transport system permease subunit
VTSLLAPAIVLFRRRARRRHRLETGHAASTQTIPGLAVILLLIAAMAAAAFLFLLDLRRIIDSVGAGDPFIPANARRLTRMGWLTLAVEGMSARRRDGRVAGRHDGNATAISISRRSFLLAIVLFILARVFREGARMRDDLEGTV